MGGEFKGRWSRSESEWRYSKGGTRKRGEREVSSSITLIGERAPCQAKAWAGCKEACPEGRPGEIHRDPA